MVSDQWGHNGMNSGDEELGFGLGLVVSFFSIMVMAFAFTTSPFSLFTLLAFTAAALGLIILGLETLKHKDHPVLSLSSGTLLGILTLTNMSNPLLPVTILILYLGVLLFSLRDWFSIPVMSLGGWMTVMWSVLSTGRPTAEWSCAVLYVLGILAWYSLARVYHAEAPESRRLRFMTGLFYLAIPFLAAWSISLNSGWTLLMTIPYVLLLAGLLVIALLKQALRLP